MTNAFRRTVVGVVLVAGLVAGGAMDVAWPGGRSVLSAQTPGSTQAAGGLTPVDADDTRREFRSLLARFPPALGVVLKSDPTLLTNETYLASYSGLSEFLKAHPEIPRDPAYYLSHVSISGDDTASAALTPADQMRRESIRMWERSMGNFLFLIGFATAISGLLWLVRYIVEHRRWLRATRIQSEAHNRILERFTSPEEMAAYMQSEAGAQFLNAAPLSIEAGARRAPGAPFSRILWSAQAGLVLIAAGIGFIIIQRQMVDEVAQMLGAWGTLAMAVGVGFVISAGAAYVISSRMGLLDEHRK